MAGGSVGANRTEAGDLGLVHELPGLGLPQHFSGKRDSAHFMRHKSYRRMLYQLRTGDLETQQR